MLKLKSFLVFLCLMGSLAAAEPEIPPAVPNNPIQHAVPVSYEGAFFKMMLTLAGLLILIFLTVWLLRRLAQGRLGGGGQGSRTIKVLEKRSISPKSVLYLLEIDGKRVLIAESQFEVRRIVNLDKVTEEES